MIEIDRNASVNDYNFLETFLSAVMKSTADCLKRVDSSISISDSCDDPVGCGCSSPNAQSKPCFFRPLDDFHYSFLQYVQTMDIEKPQSHFEDKVSTDIKCFYPHLKEKHNAKSEFKCERLPSFFRSVVAYDTLPSMFLLTDYSRQIGVDLQNNVIHGYLNPYAYEVNRAPAVSG